MKDVLGALIASKSGRRQATARLTIFIAHGRGHSEANPMDKAIPFHSSVAHYRRESEYRSKWLKFRFENAAEIIPNLRLRAFYVMRFEVSRCLFEKLLAVIETKIRRVESCFQVIEKRALGACAQWAFSTLSSLDLSGCDKSMAQVDSGSRYVTCA